MLSLPLMIALGMPIFKISRGAAILENLTLLSLKILNEATFFNLQGSVEEKGNGEGKGDGDGPSLQFKCLRI